MGRQAHLRRPPEPIPAVEITTAVPLVRPGDAVVVIDVVRAFTTAAVLLQRGASEILCVRDVGAARRLVASRAVSGRPVPLVVGEKLHPPFPHVDLPNSPSAVMRTDVSGRSVVLFTVNGTRLLDSVKPGVLLLCGAAVNAGVTAARLLAGAVAAGGTVHLVVTDTVGLEDVACAEHLRRLLRREAVDHRVTEGAVLASAKAHEASWGAKVTPEEWSAFLADIQLCARVDSVPELLLATHNQEGALVVQPSGGRGYLDAL